MFEEILSKNEKESLALLGKSGILDRAYLAGGTALALQIGHRFSYDGDDNLFSSSPSLRSVFDFFAPKEFSENIMAQRLTKLMSDFRLERKEEGVSGENFVFKRRFGTIR